MRIAVMSDIHSNIEALEAVLAHAATIDGVWCTGDIVGYGADPGAVIARLRSVDALCVAGNHDLVACGKMGVEEFNPVAAEAALWTAAALDDESRAWLSDLPLVVTDGDFTLVHGTLRRPAWEYLLDGLQAEAHFALQTTPYSIVGHTHVAMHCAESVVATLVDATDGEVLALGETRLILNPGSVGQPRDGDPRAGYMLYDDAAGTVTWHRVEYDIAATQRKIIAAGLPKMLAERLWLGV